MGGGGGGGGGRGVIGGVWGGGGACKMEGYLRVNGRPVERVDCHLEE